MLLKCSPQIIWQGAGRGICSSDQKSIIRVSILSLPSCSYSLHWTRYFLPCPASQCLCGDASRWWWLRIIAVVSSSLLALFQVTPSICSALSCSSLPGVQAVIQQKLPSTPNSYWILASSRLFGKGKIALPDVPELRYFCPLSHFP